MREFYVSNDFWGFRTSRKVAVHSRRTIFEHRGIKGSCGNITVKKISFMLQSNLNKLLKLHFKSVIYFRPKKKRNIFLTNKVNSRFLKAGRELWAPRGLCLETLEDENSHVYFDVTIIKREQSFISILLLVFFTKKSNKTFFDNQTTIYKMIDFIKVKVKYTFYFTLFISVQDMINNNVHNGFIYKHINAPTYRVSDLICSANLFFIKLSIPIQDFLKNWSICCTL